MSVCCDLVQTETIAENFLFLKEIAENFEIIAVPCASILSCTFLGVYQFAPPDPECINGYWL